MSFASHAVRAAGPSSGTWALAGVAVFCLSNPEKALQLLQRALLLLSDAQGGQDHGGSSSVRAAPSPIVIHAGPGHGHGSAGGGAGRGGILFYLVQMGVGVGVCWGSYALLVNVLPEQAKNMLPVTQGTFKTAVTSLGKGLLHVKDSLSKEIAALLDMQSELASKQDETHEQVLYVQDQVSDVHQDIGNMQTSIDDCQKALLSTDKRTTYIARGIRLVTAGMTAMLPPDDELVKELQQFTRHSTADAHSLAVSAPRNKGDATRDKTNTRRRSDSASQSSRHSASSRRSADSHQRRRSRAPHEKRRAGEPDDPAVPVPGPVSGQKQAPTNYPPTSSSDTLSVSTGTPIRNIIIPRKGGTATNTNTPGGRSNSDSSFVSPEIKELEEVRALLLSMDENTRRSMPMM